MVCGWKRLKKTTTTKLSLCPCVFVTMDICVYSMKIMNEWKRWEHSTPTSKCWPHGEVMIVYFKQMLGLRFARLGHIWRLLRQGARGRWHWLSEGSRLKAWGVWFWRDKMHDTNTGEHWFNLLWQLRTRTATRSFIYNLFLYQSESLCSFLMISAFQTSKRSTPETSVVQSSHRNDSSW